MKSKINKFLMSIVIAILVIEIVFPVFKNENGISIASEMTSGEWGYFSGME